MFKVDGEKVFCQKKFGGPPRPPTKNVPGNFWKNSQKNLFALNFVHKVDPPKRALPKYGPDGKIQIDLTNLKVSFDNF